MALANNSSSHNSKSNTFERVLTNPNYGLITTSAAGLVTPVYISSGFVFSSPAQEWATLSARYQQYRVKWVRVHFIATHPATVPTATVGGDHGMLLVGENEENVAATSGSFVMANHGRMVVPTYRSFIKKVTWANNSDAKLWNSTAAAIPVANSFGVQYGMPTFAANAVIASTTYYSIAVEWCVEFRSEI